MSSLLLFYKKSFLVAYIKTITIALIWVYLPWLYTYCRRFPSFTLITINILEIWAILLAISFIYRL